MDNGARRIIESILPIMGIPEQTLRLEMPNVICQ
jgi:hypothetical protein